MPFRKRTLSRRGNPQERHICANKPVPPDLCDPSDGRPLAQYVSNEVLTSKYSLVSFLPKNLFEQFRRLANMFFLMLIILQSFPMFKTLDPGLVALPVIIIVLTTAGKDGFEDYKRHVTDKQVNSRIVQILGGGWTNVNYRHNVTNSFSFSLDRWLRRQSPSSPTAQPQMAERRHSLVSPDFEAKDPQQTKRGSVQVGGPPPQWTPVEWRHLRVGEFVLLKNNEFIPADIVVLASSEPDCLCYLETKNLDGETNLKIRRGISETSFLETAEDCAKIVMTVLSEVPNNNMFACNGAMVLEDTGVEDVHIEGGSIKIPITMNNMLLRGCVLRNTEWVIGFVVYTGAETKLQLNAGETPSKRSIIERKMNSQILVQLILLAAMCIVCAVGTNIWSVAYNDAQAPFMPLNSSADPPALVAFDAFWSSLIAFQNIVPISLYLTVEIVKTLQAYFIFSDIEMYYEKLDIACVPKSWNLADDLGQIEYVFSDKTGTLTRNVMEFRRCSINGVVYGPPLMVSPLVSALKTPVPLEYTAPSIYSSARPTFYDAALHADMAIDNDHARVIDEFWRLLAVCHTVLVSKPDPDMPNDIRYKAQSPDEAALVDTAKDMGYAFTGRQLTDVSVHVRGHDTQYTLLAVLEFNSTRKRMSIIARRADGAIVLYCKGADTVIYERLDQDHNALVNDVTLKHLEIFADEGLRTLCLSYRLIPQDEFQEWIQVYNEACTALENRDNLIDAAAELIERDLILLGATAIEDRLQDGVPECIQTMREAGIKVWVLTGDKMETAISIGFSCNLLTKDMNLIVIKGGESDQFSAELQLRESLDTFFNPSAKRRSRMLRSDGDVGPLELLHTKDHALVIDGLALKSALEGQSRQLLLDLGSRCKVVICCRVSPLQKARVVELVKFGRGAITCAIGDGANDVSMIQAAHIGIGIAGEEGLQAVMASDYAIAQFRYLSRLLLVHGRWSYHRISELIFNYFYKDVIFVFANFWFQIYSGFSTEPQFEYTYLLLYNLFFTNWPVMVLGIFDKDVEATMAERVPMLYQTGIRQTLFTDKRFVWYMVEGIWQSLVCYYIPYGIYASSTATDAHGYIPDRYEMGSAMAAAAITNANVFTAFCVKSFTWINHMAIWVFSIGIQYGWVVIYSQFPDSPFTGYCDILLRTWAYWSSVVLCLVVCQLPRVVMRYVQRNYYPTDVDIVQEYSKLGVDISSALPVRAHLEEPPAPPSAQPERAPGLTPLTIPAISAKSEYLSPLPLEVVRSPAIINADGTESDDTEKSVRVPSSPEIIPPTPRSRASHTPSSSISQSGTFGSSQGSQAVPPGSPQTPTTPTHITMMKTMTVLKNRGYSFSQDDRGGMRSILMCEPVSPEASLVAQVKSGSSSKKSTASDWELYRNKSVPGRRPGAGDKHKRHISTTEGILPVIPSSEHSTLERHHPNSLAINPSAPSADRGPRSAPPRSGPNMTSALGAVLAPLKVGNSSSDTDADASSTSPKGSRAPQMGMKSRSTGHILNSLRGDPLRQYGLAKDVTGRVIDVEPDQQQPSAASGMSRKKSTSDGAGLAPIATTTAASDTAPQQPPSPVPKSATKRRPPHHARTPSKLATDITVHVHPERPPSVTEEPTSP
ncbi:hypothetical protein RI367_007437 [Sorochytrium milnesiophthora]